MVLECALRLAQLDGVGGGFQNLEGGPDVAWFPAKEPSWLGRTLPSQRQPEWGQVGGRAGLDVPLWPAQAGCAPWCLLPKVGGRAVLAWSGSWQLLCVQLSLGLACVAEGQHFHLDPMVCGLGEGERQAGWPRSWVPGIKGHVLAQGGNVQRLVTSWNNPSSLLAVEVFMEYCTDPAPRTFPPGGARSLLWEGSFVDCTEIGPLFSCSSQILLTGIIQTDVKCFSKMETNSCAFFLFVWFRLQAGLGVGAVRRLAGQEGRAGLSSGGCRLPSLTHVFGAHSPWVCQWGGVLGAH